MKASAIAAALNAHTVGMDDAEITRTVHPDEAKNDGDLAVALTPETVRLLADTKAELVLTTDDAAVPKDRFKTMILMARSRSNLTDLTSLLRHHHEAEPGIHPSAVVASDAVIGPDVSIGPFTVIRSGTTIGARTVILSQATVAEGSTIGEDCLIHPGVRIGWGCRIGNHAVIHHNASIGADGFGFMPAGPGAVEAAKNGSITPGIGPSRNPLQKIHALSGVEIGDQVEIGALTAIDRGTLRPTRVGAGTKIDDLVMIGHNVAIGTDCMLCGQVALAGSVTVGNGVVLGGRVAVADHLKIGDGAVVGGGSAVATNVPARAVYLGFPAVPREEAFENLRLMRRIKRFLDGTKRADKAEKSR